MGEMKSRTEYSTRNSSISMFMSIVTILMGYGVRMVFTRTLSSDYVGINGLFTDILSVMSLSELGVGTAISFALYKPIADGDIEEQKSLMRLFRNLYRLVALVITITGLALIPFLDYLIKDQPAVDHLILIYLLYLFNTVQGYILAYKRILIDAHQLSYIGTMYFRGFIAVQYVVQVPVLLYTHNFILFLSVQIICAFLGHISINAHANHLYPYLKDKKVRPLEKTKKKDIFTSVRAMFLHKIGGVLVNNTDNLILSATVGTLAEARYSNYFLIIGSVRQVLTYFFSGIAASVGNLGVSESKERIGRIFDASYFLAQAFFGVTAVILFEVLEPFVEFSFGSTYLFPQTITFVLCVNFYMYGVRQAVLVFRDSMGLFKRGRYVPLIEAGINLVVSLVLGELLGAIGVFLGTFISFVLTTLWVEPFIFYKYKLEKSPITYFVKYILYAAVTFTAAIGVHLICARITGNLLVVTILRAIISGVIICLVYLAVYHRTPEFALLYRKGCELLKKYLNKKTKEGITKERLGDDFRELLTLLRMHLRSSDASELKLRDSEPILSEADRHRVTPFVTGVLLSSARSGAYSLYERAAITKTEQTVKTNYRLLMLTDAIVRALEAEGISVVVIKGAAIGALYPVPELRKAGDVDLLLTDVNQINAAVECLILHGLTVNGDQNANHHIAMTYEGRIEVELHTMLAEPFDKEEVNRYLNAQFPNMKSGIKRIETLGVSIPVLGDDYFALELLLHMLQHFLTKGFGLKLLCDWVIFWNESGISEADRQHFIEMVDDCGIRLFSNSITAICVRHLGLEKERVAFMGITDYSIGDNLLEDIDKSGEFGHDAKSEKGRMVVVRSRSIVDYFREFHHQMRNNNPKLKDVVILWPYLWVKTLVVFMYNNKKIRNVSMWQIFKSAGKRSDLIKQLKLFDNGGND